MAAAHCLLTVVLLGDGLWYTSSGLPVMFLVKNCFMFLLFFFEAVAAVYVFPITLDLADVLRLSGDRELV